MERLVWFCLVDRSGVAYNGTSTDCVIVPSSSVIAQLRDAVKGKNPRKLSHCDASDLLVYANKTALDAHTADVPTNLRSSRPLNERNQDVGLGFDEDHALMVVVPEGSIPSSTTLIIEETENAALSEYKAVGTLIHSTSRQYFTQVWGKLNGLCNHAVHPDEEFRLPFAAVGAPFGMGTTTMPFVAVAPFGMGTTTMPFVAVEGSSGMGKTQFAFSLGTRERPYFYWTASISQRSQPIYRNFEKISLAFMRCVRDDIVLYNDFETDSEVPILSSLFWDNQNLSTFGFLYALLEKHLSTQQTNGLIYFPNIELKVTPCKLKTLKVCIQKFTGERQVPIFILDEMVEYKTDKLYAAFSRDVFRVCGLLVVVMGTDSKIANMIGHGMLSRTFQHKWLCLITKFPLFVSHLVNPREKEKWIELTTQFDCLSHIGQHSRGFFSKYFVEYCVNYWMVEWTLAKKELASDEQAFCVVLNKCLEYVGRYVRTLKRVMNMNDHESVESHAYAVSYSNVASERDRDSPAKRRKLIIKGRQQVPTIVMHNHFANLERSDIVDVYVDNSGFIVDQKSWSPRCYFPQVKNDLLLYLAVIGCGNCPVFLDLLTNREYSTRHILDICEKVPKHESVNEVSRSGSYLENMFAVGVMTCSRRNGVEGIGLDDFMEHLVGEFSDIHAEKKKLTFESDQVSTSGFCSKLQAMKIPFLTPANGAWPRFILNLGGCLFGDLVRPSRQAMCDLLIKRHCWFIGEAKNWSKNLDSAELYKIIMKRWVKRRWQFGLIVTNGVIKSMFGTNNANNLEVRNYLAKKQVNIVKVNCRTGEAQYLFPDLRFGQDAKRLLVILFHCESDADDKGTYELTAEEERDIRSDWEEMNVEAD
jgi:hypothetical protein